MITFAEGALTDLEQIFDFAAQLDPEHAERQLGIIHRVIRVLDENPLIGRPIAGSSLRELVISSGKTGFIALYNADHLREQIRVVAIRRLREAGYREG